MIIKYIINITIILIGIGLIGIIIRKNNKIMIIISIELCFISIAIFFIIYSVILDDIDGIIFAIFIFSLGAAETAISLSILAKLSNPLGLPIESN